MWINPLTAKLLNLNFHLLKLCLADANNNFKWVKIIQIWQNRGQLFSNRADWWHIMALTCLKGGTKCSNIWVENPIYSLPAEGLNFTYSIG